MTQHLREDEYNSILAGDARQEWLRHMKDCPECASTMEKAQSQIEQVRTLMTAAGTRPESYWTAQHARISTRLEQQGSHSAPPVWRFAMAAMALAAVIIVALLLSTPHQPVETPRQEVATLTDEQILREMEEVANSDVPTAMEPAHVLAEDMESHAASSPSQLHKTTGTSRHDR